MRNFQKPGKTLSLPAPTGGVVGGSFVKIGSIFGVAVQDAAEGELFDLETGGIYDFPKTSAQAWTIGAIIYATTDGVMTTVSTDNTKVGVAVAVAANPSGTGRVRLNSDF